MPGRTRRAALRAYFVNPVASSVNDAAVVVEK